MKEGVFDALMLRVAACVLERRYGYLSPRVIAVQLRVTSASVEAAMSKAKISPAIIEQRYRSGRWKVGKKEVARPGRDVQHAALALLKPDKQSEPRDLSYGV